MASSKKLFINRVAQEGDTSRIPVAANQVVNQNISSWQDTSEKSACSDQSDGDESLQNTGSEAVPQIPHRKRYSLRDRDNSAKFLFSYLNEENSSSPSKITVPIYPEDLFAAETSQPFTAPIIDYVIYKRIARGKGSVYSFGISLFGQIEHVDQTQKSFSAVKDLVDKLQWDSYPFVLIPVSGRNHWSLLVVEYPLSDRVKCYHVDSVAGMHQSEYVFDVTKLFFEEVRGHPVLIDGQALTMIPEQRNWYDCAVHMLYAMSRIAQYIVDHLPQTLKQDIKPLTSKCTESRASIFRDSLREELEKFASG